MHKRTIVARREADLARAGGGSGPDDGRGSRGGAARDRSDGDRELRPGGGGRRGAGRPAWPQSGLSRLGWRWAGPWRSRRALTGFGLDAFRRISANGAWRRATVDRATWLITAGWSATPADG